jgi:formate hydrogenlyase subunit 6/NADH:ubiquinone oxidoreductase subunit I
MLEVKSEYCTGCKLCEKRCPTGAIRVIEGKANIDNSLCKFCYSCVYACPSSAIRIVTRVETGREQKKEYVKLSQELDELRERLEKIRNKLGCSG